MTNPVYARIIPGYDPESACEAWIVEVREDPTPANGLEYPVVTEWGYAGPVGCVGIFLGYVAAAFHAEGYSVEVTR